jgi:GMP synthase-like glutamine amidotransferase
VFDLRVAGLALIHGGAYRTPVRALVLANEGDADPGFVGERLSAAGFRFHPCRRGVDAEWPALRGIDLVLSLGSDWSVYWDHVAAAVNAEAALLREACARGVPVLAICFGGQVLSHALGGTVGPALRPEIGWHVVHSDVAALAGTWFQWHSDRFTPPPGIAPLAHSPVAVQAYVAGRALALQFHPEVDEVIVRRWADGGADELARHGIDVASLLARTCAEQERSRAGADALVEWFLDRVAGSA